VVTFTLTFYPIIKTLEAGGRISFKDLAEKLISTVPGVFRDEKMVQRAIENYSGCLKYDGATVSFDRDARNYAKYGIMERQLQSLLHKSIPNMEEFQLYPFKTRKNSVTCYLGAPWSHIPIGEEEKEEGVDFPSHCDFRKDGVDGCGLGCGASDEGFV